jgi:hypothetical protein
LKKCRKGFSIRSVIWGHGHSRNCEQLKASPDAYTSCGPVVDVARGQAGLRLGTVISFASLRRFWAVAARRNSSQAPVGPRSRRRSSFRRADLSNAVTCGSYMVLGVWLHLTERHEHERCNARAILRRHAIVELAIPCARRADTRSCWSRVKFRWRMAGSHPKRTTPLSVVGRLRQQVRRGYLR